MSKRKKAQSILEYVLLITVIVLVIIYGANNVLRPRTTEQVDAAGRLMSTSVSSFSAAMQ